jgi:hypothetical protein
MRIRSVLAALLQAVAAAGASAEAPPRSVVLLLFDGVAPALLAAHPTPAFDRIRREGVFSHDYEPVFPSVSMINQVTISTGCWPEHHGIVSNLFLASLAALARRLGAGVHLRAHQPEGHAWLSPRHRGHARDLLCLGQRCGARPRARTRARDRHPPDRRATGRHAAGSARRRRGDRGRVRAVGVKRHGALRTPLRAPAMRAPPAGDPRGRGSRESSPD